MKNLTVSKAARAGEQLLRSPAPQPDESLMGYILRLAESNCYETPKWILELAGLKMDNLRNGWRKLCGDSIDFTLFKQITGLSEAEVNEILTCVRHVERMSALTSETALELLLEGGSGELMSFDQVREQLQEKNLNLERFAFRHDQIQQYIARLCPKPKIPIPAEPPNNS